MNYQPIRRSIGLRWGFLEIHQNLTDITLPMRALLVISDFVKPFSCICGSLESLSHLPFKKEKKKECCENILEVVYVKH